MTVTLKDLMEYNIRRAQAEGVFDNLPGAGKPLDCLNHYGLTSDVTAINNIIPHSCKIKREIEELEKQYKIASLPWEKKREVDNKISELKELLVIEEEALHHYFTDH